MDGWMGTFVLEWMSGGGTDGWMCGTWWAGEGSGQMAGGWMEGWTTPVWKRLGGPCTLRQGLLLAQPAAGRPADPARRRRPGVHVCVCVVPGCRGRCEGGDAAPAPPPGPSVLAPWAPSHAGLSLASPHTAHALSPATGRGVPALWGRSEAPSEAPSCWPPPLGSLGSFRGSRATGESGEELTGIEPPPDIGLQVVGRGAHPTLPLCRPPQPAALSHPAGTEGSLRGRGDRGRIWRPRAVCHLGSADSLSRVTAWQPAIMWFLRDAFGAGLLLLLPKLAAGAGGAADISVQ